MRGVEADQRREGERGDGGEEAEEAPLAEPRDERRAHPAVVRPMWVPAKTSQSSGRVRAGCMRHLRSAALPRAGRGERHDGREAGRVERLPLGEGPEPGVDGLEEHPQRGQPGRDECRRLAASRDSPAARSVSAIVASTCRTVQRKRRSMISCMTRQNPVAAS